MSLSLIAYIIRHGLTNAAVEDLLELINIICPNSVPSTRYFLAIEGDNCRAHIYCSTCFTYLGIFSELADNTVCLSDYCDEVCDKKKALNSGSFFLHMSVKEQLKELLPKFQDEIKLKSTELLNGVLKNLLNGRVMRELYENGSVMDRDITLLWNCDGAPLFSSSKRSIWPIQALVNEIDDNSCENKILAGIRVGKEKPLNHTYFRPFTNEMIELGTEGFQWGNPKQHSRVFVLCSTCDACARPFMRETMQFNGLYGCDFCRQRGERIERGNGFSRIYQPEQNVQLRNSENFYEDAMNGSPENPSHGVNGVSELMMLPLFDLVRGFVPDLLHFVYFGVVRMLFGLWFDLSNHQERYYIGLRVGHVDRRMAKIKPPSDISRLSRSITERRYWKASEFRAFLLYYALIVLDGVLPLQYYSHLFLLVSSIF